MDSGVDITGLVLTGRDADDFLVAQPDAAGSDDPASPDAPRVASFQMFHPYGFAGLPLDADKKGRCQALQVTIGDQDYIIALDDPRATSKLPPIKKGESFMYSAAGNFFRCHIDGKISMCTSNKPGSPDGNTVAFMITPTEFQQFGPWGSIRFGSNGWHIRHESGASMDLGGLYGIPGLPSVLDGLLTSYVTMTAARVCIKATAVLLGADAPGAIREPLAKADTALLLFGAINAMTTALRTFLDALAATQAVNGTPIGSASLVELAALHGTIATLNTAANAALIALPSTTSST